MDGVAHVCKGQRAFVEGTSRKIPAESDPEILSWHRKTSPPMHSVPTQTRTCWNAMSVIVNFSPAVARATRVAPRRATSTCSSRASVVVRASSESTKTHNSAKSIVNLCRGVALSATTLAATLATPPAANAMEGVFANPAVLGATCVAVCWGIPQTLGTIVLQKKEEAGREKCAEWGIDVSDIEEGNWGRIRERVKQEAMKRGEEMPKF